ncbi:hypothetical protein XM38_029950 [Halomicronema hongdechloris C2206]|uniref:DUF4168 domain-containing protein n=1 Tax=Halomicronema hongdechloris C2206 TaxID=1641165 RepID=A0A1Z3HP20_9CYAN|nr:hypothetical protein XM38_029950 [Halomicronema hongdechloris C2206]
MILTSHLLKGSLIAAMLAVTPMVILGGQAVAQEPQPAQAPPPETLDSQATLSEQQIEQFADAYKAIQTIQEDVQADMIQAVEAEGLTVEEFNTIAQSQQNPEIQAEVPPEQIERFSAATEQINAIRTNAREEMESAIQAEGLSVEEFEQILAMAQQDEALRQAINQRLAQ